MVRTQSDFFLAAGGRALDVGLHEYEPWMRHALELAAHGRGAVEPNPMVGAVVLDAAGRPVGEGWHRRFGEDHAEVNAFAAAGEAARGGTLVVTLEPCCHVGKTPPEKLQQYRDATPLRRNGTAEEVAMAAVYLASDASSFTTGSVIDVGGGRFLR